MRSRGMLEKLVITAFDTENYSGSSIGEFEAYLNPNDITFSYEHEYDSAQGAGTTGSRMNFKKVKPGDLSLAFFIDGTGANGNLVVVQERVALFQLITGYNGTIHRPNYLKVGWGTLPVRRCVLKTASIAYKLFSPDGVPLRAVITATFTDNSDDQTRVAVTRDESPDLTHIHLVKAGDTLPTLCQKFYGDVSYYTAVATFNNLNNFRQLQPGQRLIFPPLRN